MWFTFCLLASQIFKPAVYLTSFLEADNFHLNEKNLQSKGTVAFDNRESKDVKYPVTKCHGTLLAP